MKAVKARIVRSIPLGSKIPVCDNSGAKMIKIFSVIGGHTTSKKQRQAAAVGDKVKASGIKGNKEMRKQTVEAIIVRQKKEYRRLNGTRIKFEDNAAVIIKDERGTPKGTSLKGPISKEAIERWPGIARLAEMVA